jgi:hypothetical protein
MDLGNLDLEEYLDHRLFMHGVGDRARHDPYPGALRCPLEGCRTWFDVEVRVVDPRVVVAFGEDRYGPWIDSEMSPGGAKLKFDITAVDGKRKKVIEDIQKVILAISEDHSADHPPMALQLPVPSRAVKKAAAVREESGPPIRFIDTGALPD